jgi:hypothetical protein
MAGDGQSLDLSKFPAGVFWLRLVSEGKVWVQRLVITR